MNVNKKIILLGLFITLFFTRNICVKAFEIYDTYDNKGKDTPGYADLDPFYSGQSLKYDSSNRMYFCTQPNLKWPTACSFHSTFGANHSAALTYLIRRYNGENISYSAVQRSSSKLLYHTYDTTDREDFALPGSYLTADIDNARGAYSGNKGVLEYYNRAVKLYNNDPSQMHINYYKEGTKTVINNLDFSNGNVTTISFGVTSPFKLKCTVNNGATVTVDNTNKKITVTSNGNHVNALTTLTCNPYYDYKNINLYACTNQDIIRVGSGGANLENTFTKSISSLPYYTVQYYGNGGYTSNGQDYVYHGKFVKGSQIYIIANPFNKANHKFNTWYVRRSDGTWYVSGAGWIADSQISRYNRRAYPYNERETLKDNWSKAAPNGADTNEFYTYTFYAQWTLDSRTLTVNKVYQKADGKLGSVMSQAKFGVYTNSSCSGNPVATIVTKNGRGSATLNPGTYYVKETEAPRGYIGSSECKTVDLNSSNQSITVLNVGGCSVKVDDIKATYQKNSLDYKKALINLYNQEKASGRDYRKLLNFNDPRCEVKTNCYSENNNSCLNINYKNDDSFSENDWSCYNDTIVRNNQSVIGYCSTTFNIARQIQSQNGYYSIINAGQLLMANKNPVTSATVSSTCYSLGENITRKTINIPSVSLAGTNLTTNNSNNELIYQKQGNAYVGKLRYNYNLPSVYAKKISGKLKDENGNLYTAACTDCIRLGTGIPSRFNEGTGSVRFNYSWKLNYDTISGGSNCNYKINPEIIKYDKDTKGELQIEFRSVDPNNPFDRNANSNWCSNGDCNENNKTITDTIVNSTNSYGNKNGVKQQPKYTIKLSATEINKIKDYNKNKAYDDYSFKCENGTCKSNFLTSLKDGSLLGNNNKLVVN